MAGSYYVESLTDELEKAATELIDKIDTLGGAVSAIEQEFQQNEISGSAYNFQKNIDSGKNIVVGVNKFTVGGTDTDADNLQSINPTAIRSQLLRLEKTHQTRNSTHVKKALQSLQSAANRSENLMPHIVHAVKQYVTLGEIADILRSEFGEHQ